MLSHRGCATSDWKNSFTAPLHQFGITTKAGISNEQIRRRTQISDVMERIATKNCNCADHLERMTCVDEDYFGIVAENCQIYVK